MVSAMDVEQVDIKLKEKVNWMEPSNLHAH